MRSLVPCLLLLSALPACSSDSDSAGAGGSGTGGAGGTGGMAEPDAGGSGGDPAAASCTGFALPPTADYGARGPFEPTTVNLTGPDGLYTMYRPAVLGQDGFKHPLMTWGNGIYTVPDNYVELLSTFASHGFVVIASDSRSVTPELITAGLDWLIAQNDAPGDLQGTLAPSCSVTVGYSLGGRGAVEAGVHPNTIATLSFHGLTGAAENLHAPLMLITSTNDGFVPKAQFVQPTYDRSTVVPTLMATLEVPGAVPDNNGHLIPLVDGGPERAPAVAWLRFWVFGDEGARPYFYGPDCTLCTTPWIDIQRKNAVWD